MKVDQPLDAIATVYSHIIYFILMAALFSLCAKNSDFPMMQHFESQIGRAVRATCQAVHLFRGAGQRGWVLGITGLI